MVVPKKLCIIHTQADMEQVGELVKQLRPLEERGDLSLWHPAVVPLGDSISENLLAFLAQTDGVLIWVSPDIWCKEELYDLLRQNVAEIPTTAIIIPLLARPAGWDSDDFLKAHANNLLPENQQPLPTNDREHHDAWLNKAANAITVKIGLTKPNVSKTNQFWRKLNFWAWFILLLIIIIALYFAYPSFVTDRHENIKNEAGKRTVVQYPDLRCGFPTQFDSTHLYILITRFEDYANSNITECYGRGIESRIDLIKNRDSLPILICYIDSLSPNQSDEAARLRDRYHADIIIWGKLRNASADCKADGFCLNYQPSDTLIQYAGGLVSKKVDNEYLPDVAATDLEEGLISLGEESFDAWLVSISNLKVGRKKPEFYRIAADWPAEKRAQEYGKRANMYFALGLLDKTIADYDAAIRIKPAHLFYYKRGIAKARLKQYEDAIKDFDWAALFEPEDANVFYNRGKSKRELGRNQDA